MLLRHKFLSQDKRKKRAVSLMVGYVLLIVISIALSILVFAFLKVYVPKFQVQECPEDISLVVKEYSCFVTPLDNYKGLFLNLTLQNKGLHSIDAAYIRLGERDKKFRQLISPSITFQDGPLIPGNSTVLTFTSDNEFFSGKTDFTLEIQPALINPPDIALCEDAVITEDITCILVFSLPE